MSRASNVDHSVRIGRIPAIFARAHDNGLNCLRYVNRHVYVLAMLIGAYMLCISAKSTCFVFTA